MLITDHSWISARLLEQLEALLPGWTLRESADGGGIYGTGPAGESLSYSRPPIGPGWLQLSLGRGHPWMLEGTARPEEVVAKVTDAIGNAQSLQPEEGHGLELRPQEST